MKRWIRGMATAMAIAFVAATIVAGCKKQVKSPFPESGPASGWQKTSETRVFEARDLWQYIDGDAEQYLKAGVVSTATTDYKYQGKLEAVVDIHTMKDESGPRRIMDNEHAQEASAVQLGEAGLAYKQSVIFRKGRYLVRIVAYEATPDGAASLSNLARSVDARL